MTIDRTIGEAEITKALFVPPETIHPEDLHLFVPTKPPETTIIETTTTREIVTTKGATTTKEGGGATTEVVTADVDNPGNPFLSTPRPSANWEEVENSQSPQDLKTSTYYPKELLQIPKPDLPVGGRLSHFYQQWVDIGAEDWVLSIIKEGYRLHFSTLPPLRRKPWFFPLPRNRTKRNLLHQEVMDLLSKGALEEVLDPDPGYYSLIFLVKKKSGEMRPVTDLSNLNQYLEIPRFKMETTRTIFQSLKIGQWVTSIDLKDAYLHIPVHPKFRKYLRIAYQDRVYQFKALPFGQATAPYIFTRIVKSIAASVHSLSLDFHHYLDDWLNQAISTLNSIQETKLLLALTTRLGWIPNWEKSELIPKQIFSFIGMICNLKLGLVYPPEDRLQKISLAIHQILPKKGAIAHSWLHLIGLLVSAEKQVPFGRTHMRGIQWALASQWRMSKDSLKAWVKTTPLSIQHMTWWLDTQNTLKGVPIGLFHPQVSLYSDASLKAWGAYLDSDLNNTISQPWSHQESHLHINLLELRAVRLALVHFQTLLVGLKVMICTDNSTVVAQINKQGGTLSWDLVQETLQIMEWAIENRITLKARHIPGKLNIMADNLSRPDKVMSTEWSIHPQVLKAISTIWDPPMIDLFATQFNHKLPLYVSPLPDPAAVAVDAISMPWNNLIGYAYPPTPLIRVVLNKIMDSESQIYLIAPCWPQQPWYQNLLELLIDQPRSLPNNWLPKLLKQPRTNLYHNNPQRLKLHVWPLSRNHFKRKAFLDKCPKQCHNQSENPPWRSMKQNGNSGLLGLVKDRLIYSLPLSHR